MRWFACPSESLVLFACAGHLVLPLAGKFQAVKNPWPEDTMMALSVADRRTDFCSALPLAELRPGVEVSPDDFDGRDISVLVLANPHGNDIFPFVRYNWGRQELEGGYLVEVLDKMAELANFEWRRSFAVVNHTHSTKEEEYVSWATQHYDLVVDWLDADDKRVLAGAHCLFPFIDTSTQVIGKLTEKAPEWYEVWFSFLRPFTMKVWAALMVLVLVTALMYGLVESDGPDFEESEDDHFMSKYTHSLYLTLATFTGSGSYAPSSRPGELLSFSLSFLVLLLISAYTANLASLLVVYSRKESPVQSLRQAAQLGVPVCTCYPSARYYLGGAHDLNIVSTWDSSETYEAVQNGTCTIGVVKNFLWKVAQKSKALNPNCTLAVLPGRAQQSRAGFISGSDEDLCALRAARVMDLALLQMHNDRFFKRLSEKYYRKAPSNGCPADAWRVSKTSSEALDFGNFEGTFGVYVIFTLIAAFIGRRAVLSRAQEAYEDSHAMVKSLSLSHIEFGRDSSSGDA